MKTYNITFIFLIISSCTLFINSSIELEPRTYPGVMSGSLRVRLSSMHDDNYDAQKLRLDTRANESWIASDLTNNQYIIFGSPVMRRFHKITTTRRISGDQQILSYSVQYTVDGVNWKQPRFRNLFYAKPGSEYTEHIFTSSIYARAIKIVFIAWRNHLSGRIEVHISDDNNVVRQPMPRKVPVVRSGIVRIRLSSVSDDNWSYNKMMITSNETTGSAGYIGAWITAVDGGQHQATFTSVNSTKWYGITTQGRYDADERVNSYRLEYSNDLLNWNAVDNGRIFTGNYDRNTLISYDFYSPITARSIRFRPISYTGRYSCRIELYAAGCN